MQGVSEKASHFENEITLEISNQKAQFKCFWNAEMCMQLVFRVTNI